MTLDQVLVILQREVSKAPSQAVWAKEHGVSPQIVSDVLNKRREPGPSILAALRLEKVPTCYRRVE